MLGGDAVGDLARLLEAPCVDEGAAPGKGGSSTLPQKRNPVDAVEAIAAVAAECDFGRFVAASAQPETMRGIAVRIRSIIDRLERV